MPSHTPIARRNIYICLEQKSPPHNNHPQRIHTHVYRYIPLKRPPAIFGPKDSIIPIHTYMYRYTHTGMSHLLYRYYSYPYPYSMYNRYVCSYPPPLPSFFIFLYPYLQQYSPLRRKHHYPIHIHTYIPTHIHVQVIIHTYL